MLKGKSAVVTGSTSGIGLGVAEALAAHGVNILLNGFGNATDIEGLRTRIAREHGVTVLYDGADMSNPAAIAAMMKKAAAAFGTVDILVNNAGVTRDNLLMRMKDEEWDMIMSTNLKSVYRLSKAVMRSMMKARTGRIINVTSVVGAMGNAGQSNYAAAKAGVEGFSRALAREVGSRNITVNCVAPGFIDTDMTRALSDGQREGLVGQIPLGRLGTVADVAGAVAYLASDAASYVTGCTLHVNGGMHMG